MQWWREEVSNRKWLIINGEVACKKLVGCSKILELLGNFWFQVRCKWGHEMKIVLGAEKGMAVLM
jgi:hypothetical protein